MVILKETAALIAMLNMRPKIILNLGNYLRDIEPVIQYIMHCLEIETFLNFCIRAIQKVNESNN